MADENDSTTREYFDFSCDVIQDLYQAQSIATGANCIIGECTDWETSEELMSVRNLLEVLKHKIGSVITTMDGSEFKYAAKQ